MRTLYLCYFGLREPLVQTQVLPYLRQIRQGGIKISLLNFEPNPKEKWTREEIKTEREKLADEEIDWHFLPYQNRFPCFRETKSDEPFPSKQQSHRLLLTAISRFV